MIKDSLVCLPPIPAPHWLLNNPLQNFEQLTAPSPTAVITAGTQILLLWNVSIRNPTMKETSLGLWRMENPTCHQEWHQYAITQSSQLTVVETQAGCDLQSTEWSSPSFSVHLCSPGTIWLPDLNMIFQELKAIHSPGHSLTLLHSVFIYRVIYRLCSIIPSTETVG